MPDGFVSLDIVSQSLRFAEFASTAYKNGEIRKIEGFEKADSEERLNDDASGTQGRMFLWNNDLIIAFRGTEFTVEDLKTDCENGHIKNLHGAGTLHAGFQAAADAVFGKVKSYIKNHEPESGEPEQRIYLCGHSLGGALATIIAYWLAKAGTKISGVFTYGAPRVGDSVMVADYRVLGLDQKTTMWVASNDPVPRVMPFAFEYAHVVTTQFSLKDGAEGRANLDMAAASELEASWLASLPEVGRFIAFCEQFFKEFQRLDPKEHGIDKSYVVQLKMVKESLTPKSPKESPPAKK